MKSTEQRIFNFSLVEVLMMVGMAALQVLVVRFFFQGARKGESKRAWDGKTTADESRIRVNLIHHTGRELRHIMISMSNMVKPRIVSANTYQRHCCKIVVFDSSYWLIFGSLLLDILRKPGSNLPVSNELLKICAPA